MCSSVQSQEMAFCFMKYIFQGVYCLSHIVEKVGINYSILQKEIILELHTSGVIQN